MIRRRFTVLKVPVLQHFSGIPVRRMCRPIHLKNLSLQELFCKDTTSTSRNTVNVNEIRPVLFMQGHNDVISYVVQVVLFRLDTPVHLTTTPQAKYPSFLWSVYKRNVLLPLRTSFSVPRRCWRPDAFRPRLRWQLNESIASDPVFKPSFFLFCLFGSALTWKM